MVYAFFIHTTDESLGVCRILYSHCFSVESNSVNRETRKERLQYAASLVQKQFEVEQKLAKFSVTDDLVRLTSDRILPEMKEGFIRVDHTRWYGHHDHVVLVWQAAIDLAYTLVCFADESTLLAHSVLRMIIHCLQEHVNVMLRVEDILTKADWIDTILSQVLPHGQLLFMNSRHIAINDRQLQRRLV